MKEILTRKPNDLTYKESCSTHGKRDGSEQKYKTDAELEGNIIHNCSRRQYQEQVNIHV